MTQRNDSDRWGREDFDPAYLDSHACATWAYLLATEDALRAGLDRLAAFGEHGATNHEIVADALAKRFAATADPLPGERQP